MTIRTKNKLWGKGVLKSAERQNKQANRYTGINHSITTDSLHCLGDIICWMQLWKSDLKTGLGFPGLSQILFLVLRKIILLPFYSSPINNSSPVLSAYQEQTLLDFSDTPGRDVQWYI